MGSATTQGLIPLAATLISLVLIHSTPAISFLETQTIYDILDESNFPVGILPQGVRGYDLNITTGKFSVYFRRTCSLSLPNSDGLKFKPTIKGYISNRKLSGLNGVYVREFLLWRQIEEILRKGDDLVFSGKGSSYVFRIHYFAEATHCECGFRCGGGLVRKLRTNPFVSPYGDYV